ncbi:MAG TPA: potassium channel family protein [Thermoleophilaceae bacterium]|nr:potassium channel family protein [Thermoleophilaceae bacterium]
MKPADDDRREGAFRYGAVLVLTLAIVVVVIAAPAGDWSRAIALTLEFAALIVAILTSRTRARARRHRAIAVGVATAVMVVIVGTGAVHKSVTFAIAAVLAFLIPASLAGGLFRLIRSRGVNLQVVAGALAIYLLIGLLFAFAVSLIAVIGGTDYFAQGGDGTLSERAYYSFTILTTTGLGDFTAAHPGGRAVAVVEMLTGQLYLVTVIGVLVGDMASRRHGIGS